MTIKLLIASLLLTTGCLGGDNERATPDGGSEYDVVGVDIGSNRVEVIDESPRPEGYPDPIPEDPRGDLTWKNHPKAMSHDGRHDVVKSQATERDPGVPR